MDKEMRKIFMENLVDEFKIFVLESIQEGYGAGYDDHLEFLDACMTVFIEQKSDESELIK
jgi:hypothetical protein